jgi:hypothetical protein
VLTAAGCLAGLSARTKPGMFRAASRELLAETSQAHRVQYSRCDKAMQQPIFTRNLLGETRQAERVQCNRCRKQYSSSFLLPCLESVQPVVLCRSWLQCRHGLGLRGHWDRLTETTPLQTPVHCLALFPCCHIFCLAFTEGVTAKQRGCVRRRNMTITSVS